jgi:excinuclease ABC subunit C
MSTRIEQLREEVSAFPDQPGVYRYYNAENTLIYVGKAKSLRKRVSSYFQALNRLDGKTRRLVSQINSIAYTIVNTEYEALLLENNLIKTYKPKYNILLRDDKTFPFILLTNEPFPRLIPTRKADRSKGKLFGPYTNVGAMHDIIEALRKTFLIRTCDLHLQAKSIEDQKFKVCLEYHIGNCKGPCAGLQAEPEYLEGIERAKQILNGRYTPVKQYLQQQMRDSAEKLEFEQAERYKYKWQAIERLDQSTLIVNPDISDLEAYSIASDEDQATIGYMRIMQGHVVQTEVHTIKKVLSESDGEILMHVMLGVQMHSEDKPSETIANIPYEKEWEGLPWTTPKIGDKKKLVDLLYHNAKHQLIKNKTEKEPPFVRVLKEMQTDLHLPAMPKRIECFDNSNFHGTNAVAAMVCFINGKPAKKEYRHFNIKTVEGPDDFASMREIIGRRYKRVLEEAGELPNLIIVDGGKGQLSAACEALAELDLLGKVPILSIAKNLEELFYPNDPVPLHLSKKSITLRVIQQLRDEAHRFGITHHRDKRSKAALGESSLLKIPGVGPETFKQLITAFGSMKSLRTASEEEIAKVIGAKKATLVKQGLTDSPSV